MTHTIHIVTHTHWDREWYLTFQQFRLKLVHLIDGLVELLEKDPDYRHFMLDGQTIVLDDYLFMRPERVETLRKFIREGRISIGPWYVMPDEFLVSPEAIIRNLLAGERSARLFGGKMKVGYIPDPFGHIGQMPQILQGFGIETASLQRGLSIEPCEFWWQSPDSSRVLMGYLRDGYGNAADLPAAQADQFVHEVRRLKESLAPYSPSRQILLMWGVDHMEPSPGTSKAIAACFGKLEGDRVLHSTLEDYFNSMRAGIAESEIPVISGELRSPKRSPLLPNVLSARMWIKQRNRQCENLMEKWVEPFSTFACLVNPDATMTHALRDPAPIIRQTWRMLLENHPHDSICGCSIDQVHEEMRSRFDQVEQIGEEITSQSLQTLAGTISTVLEGAPEGMKELIPIVVFNPSGWPRSDLAQVEVEIPRGWGEFVLLDRDGKSLAYKSSGLGNRDLINILFSRDEFKRMVGFVSEGRVAGMSLREIVARREGNQVNLEVILSEQNEPDMRAWRRGMEEVAAFLKDAAIEQYHVLARSASSTRLDFVASHVPGAGYATFWLSGEPVNRQESVKIHPLLLSLVPLASRLVQNPAVNKLISGLRSDRADRPPYRIENEFFTVLAEVDGTLSLQDKQSGVSFNGLNRLVDGGDCGDEYNYCPPRDDSLCTAYLKSARVEKNAVSEVLQMRLEMKTPLRLMDDRKGRDPQKVALPINCRVTLYHGIPRVDIRCVIDNKACDHRLRVHFAAPFRVHDGIQDGHFEVVRRAVALPNFDESWVEHPRPEVPQRAFTSITSGKLGLTIANRGLPEVEVISNHGNTSEIAVTMLRCIGWLSRDDLSTRKGHAGPSKETPGAQMPGQWAFDYSIIPFQADRWLDSYRQAYDFSVPFRAMDTAQHPGSTPDQASFITVEPEEFILSAVKITEEGSAWLLRGYNISDHTIEVKVRPWRTFLSAGLVNLLEELIAPLDCQEDGRVEFQLAAHKIGSIRFSDNP